MKKYRVFLVVFLIVAMSMLTGWRSHHRKHPTVESTTEIAEPKTLDLSLPMRTENNTTIPITPEKSVISIEKPKKIQRELELDTQSIMSIEPEAGKIKTFDGAGITINLKR
ncbi:hypothetical protein LBMAG43_08000 [Methylococcaceae bacterium]|nr:hypothetical protein LBMAG43_08000 [Methylococcaceae bacterium]